MRQHAPYPAATKRKVLQPDRAATTQLGADGCQTRRTGSRGCSANIAVIANDDREGRSVCLRGREIASM